jgi:anti-sigma factor RsiW
VSQLDIACEDLVEMLSDHLDGGLTSAERARLDDHLATCEGCTNALEQFRETISTTGRITEDQVDHRPREAFRAVFTRWLRDEGRPLSG